MFNIDQARDNLIYSNFFARNYFYGNEKWTHGNAKINTFFPEFISKLPDGDLKYRVRMLRLKNNKI